MGPIGAVFDTNILIDYMIGIPEAAAEIRRFPDSALSIITWMEVMAGTHESEGNRMRSFLRRFKCLPISNDIAERATSIRRVRKVKLPDAIIQATAQVEGRLLVTRNTRDFPVNDPGVRIPYRL